MDPLLTSSGRIVHEPSVPDVETPPLRRKSHARKVGERVLRQEIHKLRPPARIWTDGAHQVREHGERVVYVSIALRVETWPYRGWMIRQFHCERQPAIPDAAMVRAQIPYVSQMMKEGAQDALVQSVGVSNYLSIAPMCKIPIHRESWPSVITSHAAQIGGNFGRS